MLQHSWLLLLLRRRLSELETLRHSLQLALSTKLSCDLSAHVSRHNGEADELHFSAAKVIMRGKEPVLCHTPHFLDVPDRAGLLHGRQKVTGYYHSGHF
jgi:hypothetical protein